MAIKRLSRVLLIVSLFFTPLNVNADFGNESKIPTTGAGLNTQIGYSVAIDSDLAIAGRWASFGYANFLERDTVGDWSNPYNASQTSSNDRFGFAVAISGNTAIVGASRGDDGSTDAGYAKIFVKDPSTGAWSEQQKLLASDPAANAWFGHSVDVSGDTAIVGAYGAGTMASGAAYVFVRDGAGVWTEQQKLLSTDIAPMDNFGVSVAIDGNTAIVGARLDDGTFSDSGSAYIFVRDVAGTWAQEQKLNASTASTQHFGYQVSIEGDTAVVSTSGQTLGYVETVHVFVRNAGVWTEQQELAASDGEVGDDFGASLSINGNTLLIGAPSDSNIVIGSGSVYVYMRNAGVWTEQPKILASDAAVGDQFGTSVSISGNTLIVGAPGDDDTFTGSGSVYVYTSTTGSVTAPDITVTDSVAPFADLEITFGDVTELTFTDQTVTITNDGTENLVLGTMALVDTLVAPFSILNDTCSGKTLGIAESCTFAVRFAPTGVGAFSDSLDIPSNDTDENPVTFGVIGAGTAVPTLEPDITVTDSLSPNNDLYMPFGNVAVGAVSDQVVTITNDGNADLVLGNIAAPLVDPFSLLNDACSGQTLRPAENCTFTIRFAPTAPRAFSDSFGILSNDPDENPEKVDVDGIGTAVPVPDITVTDTVTPFDDLQVSFGDLTEGLISDQTVTITNDGNADLEIGNIAVANPVSSPFSLMNNTCSGQTLSAGTSCTFDVRFAPTKEGNAIDSFDVPSNDPDENSLNVSLSGTGLSSLTNNPPSKPSFVAPANGQEVSLLPGDSVALRWTPSTDPDGDVVHYDVYVCTDADPISNCSANPVSSASLPRANTVIYASALPVSKSGSLALDIALAGFAVILMLIAVTWRCREGFLLLVLLMLAGSLMTSCGDNDNSNVTPETVEYQATDLSIDTTYYWTVVAQDDQGGETFSDTWSFTTR